MAEDLGNLAAAIETAGFAADGMVVIAAAKQAAKLRLLAGPAFGNLVLGSAAVTAGTIIGIAPAAVAVGYVGANRLRSRALEMDRGFLGSRNLWRSPCSDFRGPLSVRICQFGYPPSDTT
ncbi:MAG TPA: hypothetical protein VFY53_02915 [Rhodoplanes sp.]|nr:hypothetical protein [Rhodoplanes sp.]